MPVTVHEGTLCYENFEEVRELSKKESYLEFGLRNHMSNWIHHNNAHYLPSAFVH